MVLENGKLQLLPYHLQRLTEGCQVLGMPFPEQLIDEAIQQVINTAKTFEASSYSVKLLLTRGSGERGYAPEKNIQQNLMLSLAVLPEGIKKPGGIALHLCKTPLAVNKTLAGIKHLNRLEQVLAAQELQSTACDEGLMLDTEGKVIAGTKSNFFLVSNQGVLMTPCLQYSGITGTVRRCILENIVQELGLECQIADISLDQVYKAQSLFVTNSIIGLQEVASFGPQLYKPSVLVERLSTCLLQRLSH